MTAGSIDSGHLLLVGAGPGLGLAVAHRFAAGGYRVTLVARSADRLAELARSLDDTGAEINTVEADASSPEDLRARIAALYRDQGAPGVVIYNAVLGRAGSALGFDRGPFAGGLRRRRHRRHRRSPGSRPGDEGGRIRHDHRHRRRLRRSPDPGPGDSLARQGGPSVGGNDARRRSGPAGIRVATLTIAGQIVAGTAFDPVRIAERYWQVVQADEPWQAEFRFTGDQDATS